MEKILLAGVTSQQVTAVRKIADELRIKLIDTTGTIDLQQKTVQELLDGNGLGIQIKSTKTQDENGDKHMSQVSYSDSLMLMSELTQKHFDRVLAKLREQNVEITYKCIVTPTNRSWTMARLYAHMEMEKKQMEVKPLWK